MVFHMKYKVVCYLNAHGHVLIQEFKLIAEVAPDDFFVNPHVRQCFAALFEYNLELFCTKARVLYLLE
jgi:hypothetical protein